MEAGLETTPFFLCGLLADLEEALGRKEWKSPRKPACTPAACAGARRSGAALKSNLFYLECIERIEHYCADGEQSFASDEVIEDRVLPNLQVLTESSQRISLELKTSHAEVDWRALAGFRNVLVHDYLGINVARVWRIVSDVPLLKRVETTDRRDSEASSRAGLNICPCRSRRRLCSNSSQ